MSNEPVEVIARRRLNAALFRGKIVKGTECEDCGATDGIEAHHPDYSKPLEVEWLCVPCHRKHHGRGPGRPPRQPINPKQKVALEAYKRRKRCQECGGCGITKTADGAKLRYTREALGVSLREVARRVGVSPMYLSDLERNLRRCSEEFVANYLTALGVAFK